MTLGSVLAPLESGLPAEVRAPVALFTRYTLTCALEPSATYARSPLGSMVSEYGNSTLAKGLPETAVSDPAAGPIEYAKICDPDPTASSAMYRNFPAGSTVRLSKFPLSAMPAIAVSAPLEGSTTKAPKFPGPVAYRNLPLGSNVSDVMKVRFCPVERGL